MLRAAVSAWVLLLLPRADAQSQYGINKFHADNALLYIGDLCFETNSGGTIGECVDVANPTFAPTEPSASPTAAPTESFFTQYDTDGNGALSEAATVMASIRGRYISLASSAARRSRLEGHLQTLGIAERYSWFPAICGDNKAAAARGLKTGEWGLWQS